MSHQYPMFFQIMYCTNHHQAPTKDSEKGTTCHSCIIIYLHVSSLNRHCIIIETLVWKGFEGLEHQFSHSVGLPIIPNKTSCSVDDQAAGFMGVQLPEGDKDEERKVAQEPPPRWEWGSNGFGISGKAMGKAMGKPAESMGFIWLYHHISSWSCMMYVFISHLKAHLNEGEGSNFRLNMINLRVNVQALSKSSSAWCLRLMFSFSGRTGLRPMKPWSACFSQRLGGRECFTMCQAAGEDCCLSWTMTPTR